MVCSTIREILLETEKKYGAEDAIRYKVGKNEIEAKSYTQLKEDSESFSGVLESLGELGGHIAITGRTSYPWLVSFFGIVNSGSVAVPLDMSLPAAELCELIDRADVTVLVLDEVRADVAAAAKENCPKLKYIISMQKEEHGQELLSFWKLLEEEKSGEQEREIQKEVFSYSPEPDQLCTIMFTSGTTGKSCAFVSAAYPPRLLSEPGYFKRYVLRGSNLYQRFPPSGGKKYQAF